METIQFVGDSNTLGYTSQCVNGGFRLPFINLCNSAGIKIDCVGTLTDAIGLKHSGYIGYLASSKISPSLHEKIPSILSMFDGTANQCAILMIGTNDILYNVNPVDISSEVITLCYKLLYQSRRVFVTSVPTIDPKTSLGSGKNQIIDSVNRDIEIGLPSQAHLVKLSLAYDMYDSEYPYHFSYSGLNYIASRIFTEFTK
jgi:hypothetical protein